MELKTEGIVINTFKKGEKDNLTIIFSKDKGKIIISSKSTQKLVSKLKPYLEIFTINFYQLTRRNNSNKYFKLIQAKSIDSLSNIRGNIKKIGYAYFVIEILNNLTEFEDKNEEIYFLAKNTLKKIENSEDYDLTLLLFKINFLRLIGYDMLKNKDYLKKYEELKIFKNLNFDNYKQSMFDENLILEISQLTDNYISTIIDKEILSLKFLKMMK